MKTVIAICALLVLASCGGSSSEDGAGSSKSGGTPKCSTVWVAGKTIPKGYEGCIRPDGDLEAAISTKCQGVSIYTYEPKGDGFYTTLKGKIVHAGADYADTKGYPLAGDC